MDLILNAKKYAQRVHDAAGCTYGDDNGNYMIHLEMVWSILCKYDPFVFYNDSIHTRAAAWTHDTIEDAQQTFNDVMNATNREVAEITLAVTDVPAENRLLRHLLTLPKTVKDHRAIILKMCDLAANSSYGKKNGGSMYKKYQEEYTYKRYIFQKAVRWYPNKYNINKLNELWDYLDNCHDYKIIKYF